MSGSGLSNVGISGNVLIFLPMEGNFSIVSRSGSELRKERESSSARFIRRIVDSGAGKLNAGGDQDVAKFKLGIRNTEGTF